MTMIKWINASKLHEIKEVLKLDLQNLVLRYLILISMKIQRSRPTPTTSKSTSRQSFAPTDSAALITLEQPGLPGNWVQRSGCCKALLLCCQERAKDLDTLQSLPIARPCMTWPRDTVGLIKQAQPEARLGQGVLSDRKKDKSSAHEVRGVLCNYGKLI